MIPLLLRDFYPQHHQSTHSPENFSREQRIPAPSLNTHTQFLWMDVDSRQSAAAAAAAEPEAVSSQTSSVAELNSGSSSSPEDFPFSSRVGRDSVRALSACQLTATVHDDNSFSSLLTFAVAISGRLLWLLCVISWPRAPWLNLCDPPLFINSIVTPPALRG